MPNDRQLKRRLLEFSKDPDGNYVITPPKHKGLVLSGGGAKGICYVGMIEAMEHSGHIKNLTHVSGASAGAMTAGLIAIGMPQHDISKLIGELDISKLMDKDRLDIRAKGDRFRNILDMTYMLQMKHHLQDVAKPIPKDLEEDYAKIKLKILWHENALKDAGLTPPKNVDDIIKLSKSPQDLEKMDKAGNKSKNQLISFSDLTVLRNLLPVEKQHLIKNLSVGVTNQTHNKLETYSENTTPEESIAQVVQWSGAHPALFVPGKNAKGESIADGGILDNMPEIQGLDREEVLCVKAEAHSSYEQRVSKAKESAPEKVSRGKSAADSLIKTAIGGKWLSAVTALYNREKVYHHMDNMIYIDTGAITTTNTAPTEQQKTEAIDNGRKQTKQLLESHKQTFDHPLLAVLYVGVNKLDETMINISSDPELVKAAAEAKVITILQEHIVTEMKKGQFDSVKNSLKQIETVLVSDAGMTSSQKNKAYALCIKQINHLSEGQLANFLANGPPESWKTKVLKFLTKTIDWILSKTKSAAPKEQIEAHEQPDASKSDLASAKEVELVPTVNYKEKLASLKKADAEEHSEQFIKKS